MSMASLCVCVPVFRCEHVSRMSQDIVNSILATPIETRPTVLTTSYGFNEADLPIALAV
jgi:hypothetical protein